MQGQGIEKGRNFGRETGTYEQWADGGHPPPNVDGRNTQGNWGQGKKKVSVKDLPRETQGTQEKGEKK